MPTIDIYTTPTCGFCHALKAFLNEREVNYTAHDITADPAALAEMQSLSGGNMGVPFIVYNKGEADQSVQTGFDASKVSQELNL